MTARSQVLSRWHTVWQKATVPVVWTELEAGESAGYLRSLARSIVSDSRRLLLPFEEWMIVGPPSSVAMS